jgi:hypothetical protein
MATFYNNFDFNPVQTVLINDTSYTVPEGKYGLFTGFEAFKAETFATNLVTGTYNIIPEVTINGQFIRCTSRLSLQTSTSGVRTYTIPYISGAFKCNRLTSRLVTTVFNTISWQYIYNVIFDGFTSYPANLRASAPAPSVVADFEQNNVSSSTDFLLSSLVLTCTGSGGVTTQRHYFVAQPPTEETLWLKSGDVISATNGGSVRAIGTLYTNY